MTLQIAFASILEHNDLKKYQKEIPTHKNKQPKREEKDNFFFFFWSLRIHKD
jgi:hypothetical protein